MITNFKIFEVEHELLDEFEVKKWSCWTIFGSQSHCVEILKKMKTQFGIDDLSYMINGIQKNIDKKEYDAIGNNIFYDEDSFSYSVFEKEYERKGFFDDYTYQGEIKEVDGKIVVDTFEVYTKKYNL